MEFTEIWLQGSTCLVNAEHKQANKCFGIFNRHLIALNIEQMIVITGIPYMNAATEKRHILMGDLPAYLHLFVLIYVEMVGYNVWRKSYSFVAIIRSFMGCHSREHIKRQRHH